jgi:hypothetical protein
MERRGWQTHSLAPPPPPPPARGEQFRDLKTRATLISDDSPHTAGAGTKCVRGEMKVAQTRGTPTLLWGCMSVSRVKKLVIE